MKRNVFLGVVAASALYAGCASAGVSFNASGWTVLDYNKNAEAIYGSRKARLSSRFNLNIKASKKTDSGFGIYGRFLIRAEQDFKRGSTTMNAAEFGVTTQNFKLSVGNVRDSIHALKVFYDPAMGVANLGGVVLSIPYIKDDPYGPGANGVLATYHRGPFVLNAAWETVNDNVGTKGEGSISMRYKAGPMRFEAGYVHRAASATSSGYTGQVVDAEYTAGNSKFGVAVGNNKSGMNLLNRDNLNKGQPGLDGVITTIFAIHKFQLLTVKAFYSRSSGIDIYSGETRKTSYGIGATYDLGAGVAVDFAARTDRTKNVLADLGLTFTF